MCLEIDIWGQINNQGTSPYRLPNLSLRNYRLLAVFHPEVKSCEIFPHYVNTSSSFEAHMLFYVMWISIRFYNGIMIFKKYRYYVIYNWLNSHLQFILQYLMHLKLLRTVNSNKCNGIVTPFQDKSWKRLLKSIQVFFFVRFKLKSHILSIIY